MDIRRRSLFKFAVGAALCAAGASFGARGNGIPPGLWPELRYRLSMNAAPTRHPDIVAERRGGETILHSRSRGADILKLNATAGYLWTRCDGSRKLGDIVREMSGRFDVAPSRCGRDAFLAVWDLRNRGLLL
jgi:hypothetical protein